MRRSNRRILAVRIGLALLPASLVTGCGFNFHGPMCGPAPGTHFVMTSRTTAQMPRNLGGSEGYQDHGGPSFAVTSAPALNDTGSEAIPNFNGVPSQIGTPPGFVIMPNGGERPMETLNALPSPPCAALMGNG
jgi:hypothetical protein